MTSLSMDEKKAEDDANSLVEEILGATRPKHVGEGLRSGVGYIVRGAIGGVGCAVLMPAVRAAEGHQEGGILGGIMGGASGAVSGVLQAANVVGGGIVTGVGQMLQGVAATPKAIVAPSQGKWWNANQGAWVTTNLLDEERWIQTQGGSQFDEDILGDEVLPEDVRTEQEANGGKTKKVKETVLYDVLGLDPSVDAQMIKRRYFILARKFSPDRAGANPKAQEEFKKMGNAYMILTNAELRAKYDRVGFAKLWEAEEETPDVDPYLLYTFLFGSEKFANYIGRLAAATEARVGDSESSKVTAEQARLLQKRRVTRLALALADRLSKWAEDDMHLEAKAKWMVEAETLCDASYGVELVHVIGKVYSLAAVQFLGSFESGIGMPSISRWAQKQRGALRSNRENLERQFQELQGDKNQEAIARNVGIAIEKSEGDADAEDLAKDILKKSTLQAKALTLLWQQTVVDITTTIHEAAQMVLHDYNVAVEVRKKRAEALERLGVIFQQEKGKTKPIPEQAGLEEIAFHAMLDTVWRKEIASRDVMKQLFPEDQAY